MTIASFSQSHLRALAEIFAESVSHRELSDIFKECHISEHGGEPRWERILLALQEKQRIDKCGNNVVVFITTVLNPVRFTSRHQEFEDLRYQANISLALCGLSVAENGQIKFIPQAMSLPEAQLKANRLQAELVRRNVHPDVLKFCKAELMHDNYFHAVFEATKSVAEKIRSKANLTGDEADIVDAAFGIKSPVLAINTLRTEADQSEQKGFANLLKGIFGTFRNVTAHAPKVTWLMNEQDALDLLTFVSYAHKRIDAAVKVKL